MREHDKDPQRLCDMLEAIDNIYNYVGDCDFDSFVADAMRYHAVVYNIMVIGEGVRKVFEEVLVPNGMGDVSLHTELGRFMLAPYGHLVTKAIHEKHIHKEYIGVDACAVNLLKVSSSVLG